MIVSSQTEARASTIIDYAGPFDLGLKAEFLNSSGLEAFSKSFVFVTG